MSDEKTQGQQEKSSHFQRDTRSAWKPFPFKGGFECHESVREHRGWVDGRWCGEIHETRAASYDHSRAIELGQSEPHGEGCGRG